ncbi:DNA recombination protein RmuC [Ruania halotolerans]|uniref:DNA recombination protein RmuC n=1 Tax=Ruania halotolerans TaxID=2897773 RepID=UPI001E3D53AC|nr:DNA recombination protein RmuC [Ruania halotolerans]UFU07460.1 DNA recombination protein RmuC [Ruania halotolerans]
MDILLVILATLVGLALGGVGGVLLTRRMAPGADEIARLTARLETADAAAAQVPALTERLAAERESHARALTAAERAADERSDLERVAFERERQALRDEVDVERKRATERLDEMRADAKRMSDEFEALSAKVLAQTQEAFFTQAEERFARAQEVSAAELAKREEAVRTLVEPLTRTLTEVKSGMDAAEKSRTEAHATLAEQVTQMRSDSEYLRQETSQLVTALRAPQVRGRWGELQLRRVVEAAGMLEHVDFVEQESVTTDDGVLRPDMIVTLPGEKRVVVDAKVAFSGYLEAMESREDSVRTERLKAHARHVREHVDALGAKAYWEHFEHTPEFVVMFLPAESFLQAALEQDPGLMERAFERNVVLATPATLVALLRTVAYTWRQELLAAEAEQVFQVGRELHKRLGTLGKHLTTLGKRLNSTVEAYNAFNRSLDSQVITQARRFSALQGLDQEFASHPPLEVLATPPQKPDVYETPKAREEQGPAPLPLHTSATLPIDGLAIETDREITSLVQESIRDADRAGTSDHGSAGAPARGSRKKA